MTHNGQDIEAGVLQTLSGRLPAGVQVSADTRIVEGLGLDSVAIMDLIMDLEDRFDISIPLDRLAQVQTVAELSRAIVTLMGTPR
jgi:acyl carrier protein